LGKEVKTLFMFKIVNDIISNFFLNLIYFLPNFIGGLIIFAIGLVLSQIVKRSLYSLFSVFKLETLAKAARLGTVKQIQVWKEILIELVSWSVVILFLIPAAEVWGLSKVTVVLNQLILYLPNVFIAVIIGFIGLLMAHLFSDLVRHSLVGAGLKVAGSMAEMTRYSIVFFTVLIVLSQLGIAQDLIKILFTGIVAMVAIAGGLAFGLGGKEIAKELLDELKKNLNQ